MNEVVRPVSREKIEVIVEPIVATVSIKHEHIKFKRADIIKTYMTKHGWSDCTTRSNSPVYTYSKKFTDVAVMQSEIEDIKLLFTFDEYTPIYSL
jgi:hypothetical protein